jgi:putative ABC transport system permease protein
MDLKFALRSLRKSPGFTLLAIVVMALGIGANTAVFTVVNAVLLRPLGYADPDSIVTLSSLGKRTGSHYQVSAPDFRDWHDQSTAFMAMALYYDTDTAVTVGRGGEYAHVALATRELFPALGVSPQTGRVFNAEEEKPDAGTVAIISDSFCRNHFGPSSRALGQILRVFNRTLTIVGVLPAGFHFPEKTDIWLPIGETTTSRSAHNYLVVARLKPGLTLEQAQAQMASIGARLERQYPDSNHDKGVAVTRMRDEMVTNVRTTLWLLLGAVGVLLLISCANMANLLLAKATGRAREMAIRAAVGASRGRIVRQLIIESLVLALVAGVAGLFIAVWGSVALVALAPHDIPRLSETTIDGRVLAFTFGVSVVASLLFGLAPALQASRIDLNEALKQGAARAVIGGRPGRMRNSLVVAEIALSVVLLAAAGLLIKSFVALHNVTLGFHPEHVLVMSTSVPASDLEGARRSTRFYKDLLADITGLPGVLAAGATRATPGHVSSSGGYWLDHLPAAINTTAPQAVFSVVAPGTFNTLGIPLRRGRDFSDGDTYDAPFTAIVNEALVRKSFAGEDPIGRMILCGFDSPKPMRIVGVAGDIRQTGPARAPLPEIYMPYEQHPRGSVAMNIVVRTARAPEALSQVLQRKTAERSPQVPVKFTTMEASLSENVAAPRFRTLLLGIFAALAVCLAMAGVYGVMAYVVGQRSSEIGLRMALGANSADVLRLVLRQGMTLAGIGLAIGLAGAVAATRLLTSMLFEVKPGDQWTYAGVAALLALVALAASYLPARRAARVDPLVALRQE